MVARASRRRAVREIAAPRGEDPDPLEQAAERLDLARALAALEPDDRALLTLRYIGGLTSVEIARDRGQTESGVRGRLSRLNARLREELR